MSTGCAENDRMSEVAGRLNNSHEMSDKARSLECTLGSRSSTRSVLHGVFVRCSRIAHTKSL